MSSNAFQSYTEQLRARLDADPRVLGLVLLGSTADASYRDAWSDHDFWVITETGAQGAYLDTPAWLPDAGSILLTARHGVSYRTVLYRDGHKVEYAVFDPEQADANGKIERFLVRIDRAHVAELARAIRDRSRRERADAVARPDNLENLCLLLWTAHERSLRGERFSAHRYLLASADTLLDLLVFHTDLARAQTADRLDPRRRLEQLRPELAAELQRIVSLPVPRAGVELLDLARRLLRAVAPGLAWEEAAVVRRWLDEAGRG